MQFPGRTIANLAKRTKQVKPYVIDLIFWLNSPVLFMKK